MLVPVILSGGMGARLWPLSHSERPKPFLDMPDGQSLIQKAFIRAGLVQSAGHIITVTNVKWVGQTWDAYQNIQSPLSLSRDMKHHFLLEPCPRNTAGAIALAAQYAQQHLAPLLRNDITLLILPADHLIDDIDAFCQAIHQTQKLANQDKLVTLGIKPDRPHTQYGYIRAKGHNVVSFVEKPDLATAQSYLAAGDYVWNAGIFCMKASVYLNELNLNKSPFGQQIGAQAATSIQHGQFSQTDKALTSLDLSGTGFENMPNISADYAVFERSDNIAVVPCDMGWSDMGAWQDLIDLFPDNPIIAKYYLQHKKAKAQIYVR